MITTDNHSSENRTEFEISGLIKDASGSHLVFAHLSKQNVPQKRKKNRLLHSLCNDPKSGYMCFCLENEVLISQTSLPFTPTYNISVSDFKSQWQFLPIESQRVLKNDTVVLREAKFSRYKEAQGLSPQNIFLGILDTNGLLYLRKEHLGKWTPLIFYPTSLLLETWSKFQLLSKTVFRNFTEFSAFEFLYEEDQLRIITSSEILNVTDFFQMKFNEESQDFFFEHLKCKIGISFNSLSFKKGLQFFL